MPSRERALLERALRAQPDHAVALVNMGVVVGEAGAPAAEERAYYERAVAADPLCRDAQMSLGCAHARARDFERALTCFRAILARIDPSDAEAAQMARQVAVLAHRQNGGAQAKEPSGEVPSHAPSAPV